MYTQEQIRAYILGEMAEEQTTAFDKQLKQDHNLSERLDQCLDEMEQIDSYLFGELAEQTHHRVEQRMNLDSAFLSEVKKAHSFHREFQIFVAQEEQYDDETLLIPSSRSAKVMSFKSVNHIRMISHIAAVLLLLVATYLKWGNFQMLEVDPIKGSHYLHAPSEDSELMRDYAFAKRLYDSEEYHPAIDIFSQIVDSVNDSLRIQIWHYRGSAYLQIKAYEDAISDLESVESEFQKAEYDLALAYALAGRYTKARDQLHNIQSQPNHQYNTESQMDETIKKIDWLTYRPIMILFALCLGALVAIFPFFWQKYSRQ